MSEISESELIFKIHRIKNANGDWMPAIQDIKEHEVTPVWAAGMAYVILDRYLNCIDEHLQIQFQEQMIYWLTVMLKDNQGSAYTDKMNIPKSMD